MGEMKNTERLYSTTFRFLRAGEWTWTYDHRCMASSPEATVRHWNGAGYGKIRDVHVFVKVGEVFEKVHLRTSEG